MTQQNATLVEEAASASKSMETQAKGLLEQVSMFKISSQQQGEQVVELEQQLAPAKQKEAKARSDPASKGHVVKTGTNDGKWKNF